MLEVIIVDDEKQILESIGKKVSKIDGFKVLGEFSNTIDAYEQILVLEPDVVITDIEMPVMSGIELATKISIKNDNIKFVFLTAYQKYAVEAFKLDALHYIMKPASKEDLEAILKRALRFKIIQQAVDSKENRIFVLGQFTVINQNDKRVNWQTLKVEELFALLLMHRENGIDRWQLTHELWDINEVKDPLQNLYSTIHRMRKTFDKYNLPYKVDSQNGIYKLIISETYFDYETYLSYSKAYKNDEISASNLDIHERITKIYTGRIFGFKDYQWSLYDKEKLDKLNNHFTSKLRKFYVNNDMIDKINLLDIKEKSQKDLFL
ncbi:MAG TPA: response regulator [Clostridia bacterium]|nr:response regulator [Clostridia bacterium]